MGVVAGEAEAVAFAGILVVGTDGVAQAAGFADERQGAVAHGGELGEAAGFEEGGHEEEVGGGEDAAVGGVVEGEAGGPAGVAEGEVAEEGAVPVFAVPHDDELQVGGEHFVGDADEEVEPLLAHEAGDDGDERRFAPDGEAEAFLEAEFVFPFAVEAVGGAVPAEEAAIGGRVVGARVDAVEDAGEIAAPPPEKAVEHFAVEGLADFPGVAGTDGGDAVGVADAGFHVADLVVEFEAADGEVLPAEVDDVAHDRFREDALVFEVVDGEDGAGVPPEGGVPPVGGVVGGDEAGVPVVAVEDIGPEADTGQGFENGAGVVGVALGFVVVAVEAGAVEVVFVVEEIKRDVPVPEGEEAAVLPPPADRDGEFFYEGHAGPQAGRDGRVEGDYDPGVDAQPPERPGQGADDFAQAAGFGEGGGFGGGEQHCCHVVFPFVGRLGTLELLYAAARDVYAAEKRKSPRVRVV